MENKAKAQRSDDLMEQYRDTLNEACKVMCRLGLCEVEDIECCCGCIIDSALNKIDKDEAEEDYEEDTEDE